MKRLIILISLILITPAAFAATQFDFLLSQVRSGSTSLANGKVYFYAAGTSTPKTVWLDVNGTTPAANPYTLDANGTAQVYGTGLYRIVIKDSAGAVKSDRDSIAVDMSNDATLMHVAATETVTGTKRFTSPVSVGTALGYQTAITANRITAQNNSAPTALFLNYSTSGGVVVGGNNTVYRCTGTTNTGMLTVNTGLCAGDFVATSLHLD